MDQTSLYQTVDEKSHVVKYQVGPEENQKKDQLRSISKFN